MNGVNNISLLFDFVRARHNIAHTRLERSWDKTKFWMIGFKNNIDVTKTPANLWTEVIIIKNDASAIR